MKGRIGGQMRMVTAKDAGISFRVTKAQIKIWRRQRERSKELRKLDDHAAKSAEIDLKPRLIKPT